jgi:DNA polymerase III delta prime subunit
METRDFYVWCEKYRPQTIDECILPDGVTHTLTGILDTGDLPNLLMTGGAGVGKTTVARAIARQLDMDVLMINASDENGIDVLRTKLKDFASSMSFEGKRKMIILDEADYLSPAVQPALRGFMEEFSSSTVFTLTCNHANRIIAPLHSRCSIVDFKVTKSDRPKVMQRMFTRLSQILTHEQITFDKALLAEAVKLYFPDMRRMLNELQRFSITGTLSSEICAQISDKDIDTLYSILTAKDFTKLRKWVSEHDDMSSSAFYRTISDTLPERCAPESLPEAIVMLADYAYRAAFSADASLNHLACLVEIMSATRWRG